MGLLSTPLVTIGCEKTNIFEGKDFKGKILIIGAGAAGLYAGHLLKSNNIDFLILEASDRIGGRLGKISGFADFPLDAGAQWLHGKKSILGDLVKEKNIAVTEDNSNLSYWFQNEIRTSLPRKIINYFEGNMLPDISFEQYALDQGFGSDYKCIVEAIAGDLGADASRISAYWSNEEFKNWSSGETDYKFRATLYDLINEHIAEALKDTILLNSPINRMDYGGDSVKVYDKNGQEHTADKVIITVPISILKEESIAFNPPLSKEKTAAFQKIGMDAGMKVFLKFKTTFYPENILGGKICAAYANEKSGKTGSDNVLLAYIMGEQAEFLSQLKNDAELLKLLLQELDEMFDGQASLQFQKAHVEDWYKRPYIKGAYSYSTPGIGNARTISAEPVQNKLFFAGEAMHTNGHHQTVHGAMETAELVVKKIATLIN